MRIAPRGAEDLDALASLVQSREFLDENLMHVAEAMDKSIEHMKQLAPPSCDGTSPPSPIPSSCGVRALLVLGSGRIRPPAHARNKECDNLL